MSEPLYYDPKTGEPTGKTIGWLRDIYYSTRAVECTTTSREAFGELARELARLQRERDAALSRIEKAREVLERVHEAGEDLCEYETLINRAIAALTEEGKKDA